MSYGRTSVAAVLATVVVGMGALRALGADVEVTKVGVKGDGVTVNTVGIQKAIDECAGSGGGTVVFPAGKYVTGTVQLKSGVVLRVEEGATILGSTDVADYKNLDPFIDGSGNPMGHALIVALEAEKVGIEGKGTIDGQGPALKKKQGKFTMRPFLLRWVRCKDVTVKEATLTHPGAWTLNFFQTQGAVVEGLTIRTRGLGLANNDGVNIDSSENIRVTNCDVNSGDDALVIKSTSREKPCRNITASGCKLSTHTNAIKLGTESIGGFENIAVSNCQVTNTDMAGIALYEVDGGELKNVTVSDVTMDGVTVPISIRLGARMKTFREGEEARKEPGKIRDVVIKNVSAKNVKFIGMMINGVPGHPVEALTLENVKIEVPGGGTAEEAQVKWGEKEAAYPEWNMFGKVAPAYGIYARHVKGVTFDEVEVKAAKEEGRPKVVMVDVEGVKPEGFGSPKD